MALFDRASEFALHYLPQDAFHSLRRRYLALRETLSPILRAIYGHFDSADLMTHLDEHVGRDFEILMVHSSINHMKPMYDDSPLRFVQTLREFSGPERTLVMPAFYFGDPAIGGTIATFRQNPRFDLRRTPSQMGLATELFRRMRGVRQSRHPIYRVSALGPLAETLTTGHETVEWPCGRGSPFDVMAQHDTLILGIGKSFDVLTQIHHVEDVMGEDFPVPMTLDGGISLSLIDGTEEIPIKMRTRDFKWRRDMGKLRHIMEPGTLRQWSFHNVPLFATRARDVSRDLLAAAARGVTLYDKS
jgi:aminoglycoside 3-N-acetyltransferase